MTLRILIFTALAFLSACVPQGKSSIEGSNPESDSIPSTGLHLGDLGLAPQLAGSIRLNTEKPLTSVDLNGKVVLIDKAGHIRFQHIGESRYSEIEEAIQALLEE